MRKAKNVFPSDVEKTVDKEQTVHKAQTEEKQNNQPPLPKQGDGNARHNIETIISKKYGKKPRSE